MAEHDVARDETMTLIASDKVEGTPVFNRAGEKLGSIHNLMVNKKTGKVEYAVLSFGGVLGMGTDYYPLPWESLTYDTAQNGYLVDIDKETLKSGPHYSASAEPSYDRAFGQSVYGHYGLNYPSV
ncbi:MAG TPA: PRC-barrel domain-containing protein [Caulobacteraceae bacterium]|jgi:sporulation protein YlmC with PRC-barrel domain|nr:PRC-barrel domain-containing protein [Caulobacteraceae bacterium]